MHRYYKPDGSLYGEGECDWMIKSEWGTYGSWGVGWNDPGHWTPGIYRVQILIDGVEFAEGSFTIDEPPQFAEKPPATSALQLESLKFYESDKDDLQKELLYRIWFPQETTRFVKYKLTVRNRLYKVRDQTCQVVDRYYKPDGSLWATSTPYNWVIKSDREETALYSGKGWEEPGHWEPGDYRIETLIDGVEFADGTFKIQRPRRRRG